MRLAVGHVEASDGEQHEKRRHQAHVVVFVGSLGAEGIVGCRREHRSGYHQKLGENIHGEDVSGQHRPGQTRGKGKKERIEGRILDHGVPAPQGINHPGDHDDEGHHHKQGRKPVANQGDAEGRPPPAGLIDHRRFPMPHFCEKRQAADQRRCHGPETPQALDAVMGPQKQRDNPAG